jgi:hypothetical protein
MRCVIWQLIPCQMEHHKSRTDNTLFKRVPGISIKAISRLNLFTALYHIVVTCRTHVRFIQQNRHRSQMLVRYAKGNLVTLLFTQ